MQPRLFSRAASLAAIAVFGILLTIPLAPPTSAEVGKVVTKAAPPDHPEYQIVLSSVVLDKGGMATFVYSIKRRAVGDDDKPILATLPFRAGDLPDATRTLDVKIKGGGKKGLANQSTATPSAAYSLVVRRAAPPGTAGKSPQLVDLLDALRGQPVEVSADGKQTQKGTLLGIDAVGGQGGNQGGSDPAGKPNPPAAKNTVTVLTTDNTIILVPLTGMATVKFTSQDVGDQFRVALTELARGRNLPDRLLRVPLRLRAGGEATITYKHPMPQWAIRYELRIAGGKVEALSGRVTLRNTTTEPLDVGKLRLAGLPWGDREPIPGASLAPDDVATVRVDAPSGTFDGKSLIDQSLTYQNQQTTASPSLALKVAHLPGGDYTPAALSILEDGKDVGQPGAPLDFGGGNDTTIKVPVYLLMTIRQNKPVAAAPARICIADGFLDYRENQKTSLLVINSASSEKTLTLKPADGWALDRAYRGDKPAGKIRLAAFLDALLKAIGIPDRVTAPWIRRLDYYLQRKAASEPKLPANKVAIPGGSTPTAVIVEESAQRHVALAGWSGLKDFADSLDKSDPHKAAFQLILDRQDAVSTELADLDKKRKAMADAIQAIALRQPALTGAVPGVLIPQMVQDEAAVARLRHRMDAITAEKAVIQRDLEAFICELRMASVDLPQVPSKLPPPAPSDVPPPIPPEELMIPPMTR